MLVVIVAAGFTVRVTAQTPLSAESRYAVVDSIVSPWEDWDEVSINGKFKMAGLPVSPSLRIYMQRDSLVLISLRAPFVGEVGRAEITDSTILVVNKMKKVYVEEPLDRISAFYPGGLSDIQDLLLGRVAMPGLGELSHDIEESLDVYSEPDGTYTIVASEEYSVPGVNYGYVVDSEFWPAALLVLPVQYPDVSVTMTYEYFEKGYDLTFFYRSDKRNYQATLELDDPDWSGRPFERITLSSKYRRVDFKDFMRSSEV